MIERLRDRPPDRRPMPRRPAPGPPHAVSTPILALAVLAAACGGGDGAGSPAPITPLADSLLAPAPLLGLPGLPDTVALSSRALAGPTLLHLREGDAYEPALSPSGERIAWGELVAGEVPATRILVRAVAGGTPVEGEALDTVAADTVAADTAGVDAAGADTAGVATEDPDSAAADPSAVEAPAAVPVDTLLDLERSRRWAAYGTFLQEMAWEGEDRLRAVLSDGDVGRIELLLAVPSGEIVSQSSRQGEPRVRLPAEDRRLLDRLEGAFPDIPRRALESSFGGLLIRRASTGVLLQMNYVDTDRHVRYLDPDRDVREVVVELPDSLRGNLRGGTGVGRTTAFLLVFDRRAHLALHRPGRIRIVDSFAIEEGGGRIREVATNEDRSLFVVRTHSRSRSGTDRLYLLTEEGVTRVVAPGGLVGVTVSADWSRIAFSYWSGGDRDLRVAPLRIP